MDSPLLEVGQVARAHGLRGEVVVSLLTNRPGRLDEGSRLYAGAADKPLVVVRSTPLGHRHIVSFEGVTTRQEADALHGVTLLAPAIDDPEAMFVHELIGSMVFDVTGEERGRVTAVEANPASDLLVVEGRWYVPLRFVVERSAGRILVDVPDGLFE